MTEPKPDPIATAQGLTRALQERTEETRLRRYGRLNRMFILVDIALTVLLAGVGALSAHAVSQSSAASTLAQQNHTAQIVTCQAGNQAREQNEQLWTFLINLSVAQPARPGETAAEKAAGERLIRLLRGKVSATFAPRDCQKLAGG